MKASKKLIMFTQFFGNITLRAIISKNDPILIGNSKNDDEIWNILSRRLYECESFEEGLKQEMQGELKVEAKIGSLLHSERLPQTQDGSLRSVRTYEVTLTYPTVTSPADLKDTTDVRWISRDHTVDYHLYGEGLDTLRAYWKYQR